MSYTATSLNQLVSALATRLTDPSMGFWTVSELRAYIVEALRTWQAFAAGNTTRVIVPTAANTRFYNLFQLVPELTPTITDRDLILQIERHLQETLSDTSWIGTEQFTFVGITNAIQKRRDKFLLESGMVYANSEVAGPTPPVGVLELAESVIDVQRVAWKTVAGAYSLVWKADQFTMTGESPGWMQNPDVPTDYSTVLQTPLKLQLSPPPASSGSVNLITTNSGVALDPGSSATVLGIPDDFCWVIKFGALADIYGQEGPGQDKERAAYCEERWRDGIKLARITSFIRFGYLNQVPTFIDSMQELDTSIPSWMSDTSGTPVYMGLLGNIIGTSPIPSGITSMGFDILYFPIPGATDPIQLGQETLDVIVDYAQHLAVLKEGGVGFKATYPLYKNFVALAAVQNDRLRAQAHNFDVLSNRELRQGKEVIRRNSDLGLKELDYAQE